MELKFEKRYRCGSLALSFNRTAYGIEMRFTILEFQEVVLLIAPLMELKCS